MRRRSSAVGVALALLAVLTACVASSPQARPITAAKRLGDVVVTGRLLTAPKTGAVARPVLVTREQTAGDVFTDLFFTAFTAGFAALSCVTAESILETCRQNGYAGTTTATGSYGLRLRRNDVERASHLQLASGLPARAPGVRGATVTVTFAPRPHVRLPDVTFASRPPAVRASTGRIDVTWAAPPGGDVASYTLGLDDPGRGLTLAVPDTSSPLTVDPRLVEDAVPAYGVVARGVVDGYDVTWSTPTVRRAGTAGAPYSRGHACHVGRRSLSRCWLTDGAFGKGYSVARPARPASAVIDLGRDVPLGFVVARGDTVGLRVGASTDGRSWSLLGTPTAASAQQPATLVPPAGAHARYVRVSADESLARLTELSVWKGRPTPPPSAHAGHSSSSDAKWFIAAVAAALVVLVGAAVARSVGSRS